MQDSIPAVQKASWVALHQSLTQPNSLFKVLLTQNFFSSPLAKQGEKKEPCESRAWAAEKI